MSKIFGSLKSREWLFGAITLVLILFQVYFDLKIPDYMSEITKLVQTEGSLMSDILQTGGIMLGCSIISVIITIIVGFFAAQIATTVAMRLREQVYAKTISFSMADLNTFSTGSLITRTTNDITQIQMFIALGYISIVRAPTLAIFAIIKILGKNVTFSMAALVAVLSLAVVLATILTLTIPKSKKIQSLTDKLNTVVREHLTGVRVVRAYNAEKYQEDKFEQTNEEVASTQTFVNRTTAFMAPYMTFLMSMLTLSIYFIGAYMINNVYGAEKLTIFSDMVVFSSYAMMIIMAFMMLTMNILMLPRCIVAMNRIREVIDFENSITDGNITDNNNSSNDMSIEFKNVTFAYPNGEEAVVEDISFSVKKGQTVAIIGSTGSGKSTIINLIQRFYDCTQGEILVDGVNVRDYTQHALREKLGLVSQKAMLFSSSVGENIAYGIENIENSQLEVAVDIAQARDFVDKIGFDSHVSQGGLNLSGGQKQRLSIARAIYKNSEIYLFDDCFSALDYKTDRMLRTKLREQTEGATKIMVAQRISTVKDSDQIIVLDNGKIAGIGTHKELLSNCEVYIEIAESQLSKEELDHE
ncbi:MAG: ABC transporter ATP-binding protein [Clostridia bacterium]